MGIYGFWTALIASLTIAAIALVWCLELCSREMVRTHKVV
jgi:probable multidrug resistance protein norM